MSSQQVVPVMIYTEATPNPSTLKFVVNRPLMPGDFVDLQDIKEAEKSPFATMLFEMAGIKGVFISNNFVTITKEDSIMWQELMIPVKTALKEYLEAEKPIFIDGFAKPQRQAANTISEGDSDLEIRIKGVLEKYVKPAVEMDGGSISFVSFDSGKLTLQLQGSCSGCPSSSVTLKQGIDSLMKRFVPEVQEVVAEGE
jgi:NFU1 iron-sulfur cluster scaffold homolog, mitochondrial